MSIIKWYETTVSTDSLSDMPFFYIMVLENVNFIIWFYRTAGSFEVSSSVVESVDHYSVPFPCKYTIYNLPSFELYLAVDYRAKVIVTIFNENMTQLYISTVFCVFVTPTSNTLSIWYLSSSMRSLFVEVYVYVCNKLLIIVWSFCLILFVFIRICEDI